MTHAAEARTGATLSYKTLPSCPSEDSFRRRVATRLGYDPFVASAERGVAVEFGVIGGGVTARARVRNPGKADAERSLEDSADHCDALTDALAASVAMAVDPIRAMAAPSESLLPEPVVVPSAVVEPPAPRIVVVHDAPPATPAVPVRIFGQAAFSAAFGVLPGEGFNVEAGIGAKYTNFSATLEGRVSPQWSTATLLSGYRVDATALSAALAPCAHYNVLKACAVGRFGSMQGSSPDVSVPSLGNTLLGSLGARVEAVWPLSQTLSLRVLGEAGLPVVRTSFVVNSRQVWTAPSGQFALGTGLLVGF